MFVACHSKWQRCDGDQLRRVFAEVPGVIAGSITVQASSKSLVAQYAYFCSSFWANVVFGKSKREP